MAQQVPQDASPLRIYRASADELKIKTLLYGIPGAGKTTMALTMNDDPRLGPTLVLNFEGGLLSVVGRGDVDAYDVQTMDDLERILWALRSRDPAVAHFRSVVVDSGSELYQKALREVVDDNVQGSAKRDDIDQIQIEDYGKAGTKVFRLFSMLRDLPLHIVVTAHARFTYPANTDERTSQPTEVRPSFSASLGTRLEGIFDNVHFLYTWEEARATGQNDPTTNAAIIESVMHRILLTAPSGPYRAKTRGPKFAERMGVTVLDPTMPMLYNLLLETEGGRPGQFVDGTAPEPTPDVPMPIEVVEPPTQPSTDGPDAFAAWGAPTEGVTA